MVVMVSYVVSKCYDQVDNGSTGRLKNYVVQVRQQVPKPGPQGLSKASDPKSQAVSPHEPAIRLSLAQQKNGLACVAQGLEPGFAHH